MTLSPLTRLVPAEGVVFRAMDDGAMLVNMNTGGCFQMNRIGAEIWMCLQAGDTMTAAIEAVHLRYHVNRNVLEGDVLRLCTNLQDMGLIRPGTETE